MSPLLETIFIGGAYDIIKGTLKELFKDDTDELTKRLSQRRFVKFDPIARASWKGSASR